MTAELPIPRGGAIDGVHAGLIVLGEAGNLGDDLILIAALEALGGTEGVREVSYLSHDSPLDWESVRLALPGLAAARPVKARYDWPLLWRRSRAFRHCDVMVFGGGGLLQSTHHPLRPYQWLDFLPRGTPAVAVGLGLGPLSAFWKRNLSRGSFFNETYLRDADSIALADTELGWKSEWAHDFVDAPFLRSLGANQPSRNSLGVAVRSWPGLAAEDVASLIDELAVRYKVDQVEIFVLESKAGKGADVDFSSEIRSLITAVPATIDVYAGGDPIAYVRRMRGCVCAVSMKLHSSAVWAETGIPLLPIIYAPKVAAFFGVPWRGLEMMQAPVTAAFETEPALRSRDALTHLLPGVLGRPARRRFSRVEQLGFQVAALAFDLARKVRSSIGQRHG